MKPSMLLLAATMDCGIVMPPTPAPPEPTVLVPKPLTLGQKFRRSFASLMKTAIVPLFWNSRI